MGAGARARTWRQRKNWKRQENHLAVKLSDKCTMTSIDSYYSCLQKSFNICLLHTYFIKLKD